LLQVLPSKIIWDGAIVRFEVFGNNDEGHYVKISAGYLIDSKFPNRKKTLKWMWIAMVIF
jgi:hypothetical protein